MYHRIILFLVLAQTLTAAPVDDAEVLLQRQRYADAAATLTDAVITASADAGYAHYLRGVARAESRQAAAAITDCDAIPAGHAWQRKALFLKAQCLAELKRHQEAEAIYSAEAARLFATMRKEKLAEALIALAQEITKPAVPGQSMGSDAQNKALVLYRKAQELETGTKMREQLLFQTVLSVRDLNQLNELPQACDAYLREFDPDWRGLIGSTPPAPAAKEAGANRWVVRQILIEGMLQSGGGPVARRYAEDVLTQWKAKAPAVGTKPDQGDIDWQICRSHGALTVQSVQTVQPPHTNDMQQGTQIVQQNEPATVIPSADPAKHIASLQQFLQLHPSHARSAEAAFTLIQALTSQSKSEEAMEACKALYDRADWPAPAANEHDKRTPTERLESWRQMAFFQVGALHFASRKYPQAIEQWRAYIAKHPDGSLWQQAQARIMEAEFQLCLDAVASSNREEAARRFDAFISAHPLDARCSQLLFLNGQWHFTAAQELAKKEAGKPRSPELAALFESAIAEWARLIIKHPQSEEASLALYRTGIIQAEHFDRHEEALNTFQRLNWGGWKQLAAERAAMMPQRSLALRTPRTFRSNETAQVRVNVRNIEKLKVSRYLLNLEDFFRSRHRLDGESGIGSLDIDLIQPDKTWEVNIEGYTRLKPIEQAIDVPFEDAKPGVCLIRVEGEDWQASTIVIRSDIDLIVQSAWTEALVFVQDRIKGTAVADAEVLLSNGKEILGQGRTGKDGVFRLRGEMIRAAADLCAYVRTDAGVAIQRLNLRGMTQEITGGDTNRASVELSRRGFIYTDKSAYRAGDIVHFRGIIRDVQDGAYSVPIGREYEISITDEHKRVLRRMKSRLSDFGTFTHSIPLPASAPTGSYHITAKAMEGDESHEAWFNVKEFEIEEITAMIETKPDAVFRGDRIEGTLRVNYSWGAPLVDEPVRLRMPDGRLLEGKTDAAGAFTFTQETTAFQAGEFIRFFADLPARRRSAHHVVSLLHSGVQLAWDRLPDPALIGEPSLIRIKALDHRGKPTAATVKVTLSRLDNQPQNPVLSGLPGLVYIPTASAPSRITEFTVQTDAKTGIGSSNVVLQSAMRHQLLAQTTDARGNVVESTAHLDVSGPEDTTKLRLFSEQTEVNEGSTLNVDAHSRVTAPLALVTLAGEDMIEHRIIKLGVGHNELSVTVAAAHWPQFEVGVAFLDGDRLHSAHSGFVVKRPLKIEIQTPAQPVKPGEATEITLTTTDANGKPVAAELSLALASSALFAQYSDNTEYIDDYFHSSLRRHNSLRIGSNASFQHRASSQLLTKDESGNVIAIADGAQSHIELLRQMEQREQSVWYEQAAALQRVRHGALDVNGNLAELEGEQGRLTLNLSSGGMIADNSGTLVIGGSSVYRGGSNTLTVNGSIDNLSAFNTSTSPTAFSRTGNAPFPYGGGPITAGNRSGGFSISNASIDMMIGSGFPVAGAQTHGQPYAPDSQWHCPLVTDASGKVKVALTAPGTAGAWRLSSRGCTVTTNVGQAEKEMTTKSDFMAEVRMPTTLVSGDSFTPRLLLHGAPESETTAQATFETAGTPKEQTRSATLKPQGSTEVVFGPVKAPDMPGLSISSASVKTSKDTRFLASNFSVLPFGETTTSHALKIVSAIGETTLAIVPSQQLLLSAFSSPLTLLQSMGHSSQTATSRLLSHVSAARAGKPADESPIRLLIAELQITQQDGGWTWQDVKWQHDSVVTSLGLWALVEAKSLGFDVEDSTIKKATAYLKKALAIIPPDEPDKAATILHALACVNESDFSVANRMYRDRVKLNDPALAWLAAAFQRMNRIEEAKELLKALEAKPAWTGSKTTSRLSSKNDTTAILLYAAAKTLPGSALAKKAADALQQQLGVSLGADSAMQGLWTAALAEHFISSGMSQTPQAEELKLTLNGEPQPAGNGAVIRIPTPKAGADGKFTLRVNYKNDKATPVLIATFVKERALDPKTATAASLPTVAKRLWLHEGLRHHDKPLDAESSSPVNVAAHGQRLRVRLELKAPKQAQNGYVIIDEPLPGGCMFVPGSLSAEHARMEQLPGMLRLWFIPGTFTADEQISYELIALHPGSYRIAHTRVRDACQHERFNAGPDGKLTILAPGQPSTDPYVMNGFEHLELAELLFGENALEEARAHLELLRNDAEAMKYHERDIARMLLWIHTSREGMDAQQIVELFEALSERHPDIVIPFDKILKVAAAYRQMGEFERAWLVYRATMESSFVSDAGVSAALEAAGDFPGSAEHQTSLWMEYPDGADSLLAFFSLAQRFQEFAANPTTLPLRPGAAKWTKNQLLERSRDLLRRVLTLYAKDDLADDAAFSLTNVFFDLKDYKSVVQTAGNAATTFTKSSFLNNFHYMTALGRFWQYQFPEALAAAAPVAAGSSDDAPNARYITAQIHHAQGQFAEAVRWYEKVKDEFDDARESISMLQEKAVKLPFATRAKPGEPVKIELEHRNVKEAALLIYRVDLMKLQERQKDLSSVGSVNLSGITPQAEMKVPLGDGLDYAWKRRSIELPLKEAGAYLVICRGDSQMTSSLVLLTTLDMDVHEDAQNGAVRVQVRDTVRNAYVADADIAAYDTSGAAQPQKGRTDPRGAFNASGIHGQAVVVVKLGISRYAVYRSSGNLMPLALARMPNAPEPAAPTAQQGRSFPGHGDATGASRAAGKPEGKDAYLFNVRGKLDANNLDNRNAWSEKLKNEGKGVKAEKAFKK